MIFFRNIGIVSIIGGEFLIILEVWAVSVVVIAIRFWMWLLFIVCNIGLLEITFGES